MKTLETILEDLTAIKKDLESRIEITEDFKTAEKMVLELMKVKNAINAIKPI